MKDEEEKDEEEKGVVEVAEDSNGCLPRAAGDAAKAGSMTAKGICWCIVVA